MKNLSALGLILWVVISTSCKKGEALNPIKLNDKTSISTDTHDSTYYVYPTGYTTANAFLAPVNLGVPAYLNTKNDSVSNSFIREISAFLPVQTSLVSTHPDYLAPKASNTINIIAPTDIYVTFVVTSTSFHNTLAYYTYKTGYPPTATSGGSDNRAMDKITYIFPNAVIKSSTGGLIPGNKVKLGSFEPGTSIGFVLIFDGWTGENVKSINEKYYTEDNLNPEKDALKKRHAVLLHDTIDNLYFLGFEDLNREKPDCDNDFNDVLVYIKGTTPNSISNNNIISIMNGN